MSLLRLALANLSVSTLSSTVNILLLGLGTASIAILLLASTQLSSTLSRNAAGIDLVIGAKGSPLQLVLAGVYHADVPPGNISYEEVERWAEHPMVGSVIPLSLGDSYKSYRIVGTTTAFADLYGAEIQTGHYWNGPFEALLGARVAETTGLVIDDTFSGVHGLADAGDEHESTPYRVVGQFASTGSIIDNLIVTSTQSVWLMHNHHDADHHEDEHHEDEHHDAEHHEDNHHEDDHHDAEVHEDDHHDGEHHEDGHHEDEHHAAEEQTAPQADSLSDEVTLLLVKLSSPMGALSLPREVNAQSGLQAASPAYEVTRLLQIVGIGLNWLNAFAAILVVSAALSIFAALYASLRARRHDLAVLRCLGGTKQELFFLLFVEGLLLTIAGIIVGLFVAHGGMELLGHWLGDGQGLTITGWVWTNDEFLLITGLLAVGSLTALIPAWQAYRTDVARILSAP